MKGSLRLALAALALGLAAPALAQTASANLDITATVTNNCRISNGTLAFPGYDTGSATATDGSGSFTVTCTLNRAYTLGLGAGTGGPANGAARSMVAGADHLGYELYSDAARANLWTTATLVAGTGTGTAQTINVYGRIAALQNVPAGAYADVVVATVNF